MEQPRLLGDRYEIPADEDAQAYAFWANNSPTRTGECVAHVRFGPQTARWARERRHYAWEQEEETTDGLVVTMRMDRWGEALPWLLGWGGEVEVLSPPEVQTLLAREAKRILDRYQPLLP